MDYLHLTDAGRTLGTFNRSGYGENLLARKMDYRGLRFSKSKLACLFIDRDADRLVQQGAIPADAADAYRAAVSERFFAEELLEHNSNEAIFRLVQQMRNDAFGTEVFHRTAQRALAPVDGINQTALCKPLASRSVLLCYLSDLSYAAFAKAEICPLLQAGKRIYFLAAEEDNGILPTSAELCELFGVREDAVLTVSDTLGSMDFSRIPACPELQKAIDGGDAAFFGYGADALMNARALRLPASVLTVPEDLPSKAVTNLFTNPALCRIYIPAHFDITQFVPVLSPSRLTYYHLAALAERYGTDIYEKTPEALYAMEPRLFFSLYDSHLPPKTDNHFTYDGGSLQKAREQYLCRALANLGGVRYLHACFDKSDYSVVPVDYDAAEPQHHLLADGVIASPETEVTVYPGGSGIQSPREMFFRAEDGGVSLISNFAFFFTDRLANQYRLRCADRPQEQLRAPVGYVDHYRRTDECGVRHETFPLYRKACLAKRKRGGFTAFPFAFCGGTVTLDGLQFRIERGGVNCADGEIALFTPMLSAGDEAQSPASYTLPVGKGRLNVVLVGETVHCIRRGDVLLPPVGVVLSLNGDAAKRLENQLAAPDENGYYAVPENAGFGLRLDAPEEMTQAEWDDLEWVYGGGLCLQNGAERMTEETYLEMLRGEGWLSPLSRQTQESAVHTLALHPRTAVGVTKKGELFILVFSGRTPISEGANYLEMCTAAEKLIPDISVLINWDGGGSSLLGLLHGSVFTELNYPAPSDNSLTGMARKINSMIQIHIQGKDVQL